MLGRLFLLIMLLGAGGCDSFFTIRGMVVDRATGTPLEGAKVTLILDKGVAEPVHTLTTKADGVLSMGMNEHESAWATLTVEHSGYCTWSTQFKGSPGKDIVVKMVPAGNK
jgi:hypothetical protein